MNASNPAACNRLHKDLATCGDSRQWKEQWVGSKSQAAEVDSRRWADALDEVVDSIHSQLDVSAGSPHRHGLLHNDSRNPVRSPLG